MFIRIQTHKKIKHMKKWLSLFAFGILLTSCKKDKVPTPENYYQSKGNLMIFQIGDSLERAYEYNLFSIQLNNGNLPISIYSEINNESHYWKLLPNQDTLFSCSTNDFSFSTNAIENNSLKKLPNSLIVDSSQFQIVGNQNNIDVNDSWSKIANLEIVQQYRNSYPNSKIGISKIIMNQYNLQLGFSIPIEKFIIFLVK
jgi:hypothetical protein